MAVVLAAALHIAAGHAAGKEPSPPRKPAAPSGLVEKTGVSLVLLDIEAVDAEGRPLPGLGVEDFTVRRNGRRWPVVSVDDFCACAAPGETSGGPPTPDTAAPAAPAPAAASAASTSPVNGERPLFILYLDFAQLRPDGRHDALEAARRWVREVRAPDEPAMIAAYITSRGLLVLSQPTAERDALLGALDAADRNVTLVDPFARDLERRLEECREDRGTCNDSARQEYAHGRRSLEAFRLFLSRLRGRPGPKVVLYFHENGMMSPGLIYLPRDEASHYLLSEGVGAEATGARAVVYPLLAGMGPLGATMERENLGLGALLAEATGGAYNLGPGDFARLASSAGRGCRCRYVLGLEPVEAYSRSVSSVSVTARGVRLRPLYRMRLLSDEDAWLRKATDVLQDPGSARDLPVGAALVPTRVGDRGWDLAAQVAVDLQSLVLLPLGIQSEGRWEVGARLMRLDGHGTWDMHATSVASADIGGAPDAVLLHAHQFSGLRPGRYRLTAFIRDHVANVFGGAEAVIELPDPKHGGVAGPVMLSDCAVRINSPLPLAAGDPSAADDETEREIEGTQGAGPAPIAPLRIRRGATLLFESWICPAAGFAPAETVGLLTRDEVPLFRLSERSGETVGAGPCRRHVDEVPTGRLDPGQFLYVLRGRTAPGGITTWSAPFVVAPAAPDAD